MDLNRILCVGRTDMYGRDNSVPKQQNFYPSVSSFDMDSLRSSVRKDKGGSRSPSRYSNHSPNSRSILRDTYSSPKQDGSPCGYRNVRFTDRHSSPEFSAEFSRLHVNETTQTNGRYAQTFDDNVVQVYANNNDYDNTKRSLYPSLEAHYDHLPDEGFNTPPMSASTPRLPNDRSPSRNNTYSRMTGPESKQQRELPRTPIYRDNEQYSNRDETMGYRQSRSTEVFKNNRNRSNSRSPTRTNVHSPTRNNVHSPTRNNVHSPTRNNVHSPTRNKAHSPTRNNVHSPTRINAHSPTRNNARSPTRPSSMATQTPSAPNGQKIIQNMGMGYNTAQNNYIRDPKGQYNINGQKIIQNMDLGKLSFDKSIGVQTGDLDTYFTEMSVQTQTEEEDQGPKDVSVQTPIDEGSQTPTDIGVQTPISVESQTPTDIGIQTLNSDEEEDEYFVDAFVQTMSDDDDEESQRDVSVQTPREVGVQTPRTVSIQTSDTSDEEEDTANVAIQTQLDQNDKQTNQNLDVHTSVWSNVGRTDSYGQSFGDENCSSFLSSGYKGSRPIKSSPKPINDEYDDSSDDEDYLIPSRLTKPFPKREPINYFGKLKNSNSNSYNDSKYKKSSVLTDHSAKDLLEKECIPSLNIGASTSFCRGRDASRSKSTSTRYFSQENQNNGLRSWDSDQSRSTTIGSQYPEITSDIGTQFHSDYHLELQKQQERIQEISDSLNFTQVEFHSFDPGKLNNEMPYSFNDYSDIKESFNKNSFIKDVNLGPPPVEKDDRYTKSYRDGGYHSPTRQRLVKKVNFNDYPSTADKDHGKPNYIFFKRTKAGEKYESFDPQPRSSYRKPRTYGGIPPRRSDYMSPPRPSYQRPSSAPPTRQPPILKTNQLTPSLSHLRKHAIRKRLTDNSSSHSRNSNQLPGGCGRSDTFINSTKPDPQPLTLPLSDAAPYRYPDTEPMDAGSFESSGNQPRHTSTLLDSANLRPKNRDRSISPSPNGFKRKSEVASSNKPPIPRGRTKTKDVKHSESSTTTTRTEKETVIYPRPADNRKSRSVSTDSQPTRKLSPSKKRNISKSRDQSTAMDRDDRSRSRSPKRESYQVSNGDSNAKSSNGNSSILFGNEAVQKIIERANLRN